MTLVTDDYYTAEELAQRKKVHLKTVYRWVRNPGGPPHELLGRMYWFEKKAADAWQKPRVGRKANAHRKRKDAQ